MSRYKISIFIIVFFFGFSLWILFKDKKHECLLILNSKYFDYKSGSYILNKIIVISNALITDIVDSNSFESLDKNCLSVDLKGHFLYPGLIDAHTHLLAVDRQKVVGWKSALELSAERPSMMRLFIGEKNAKSMLLAGFTTVRELGNSGQYLDEKLNLRITNNISLGPEIITSGPGIAIYTSQINSNAKKEEYTIVNSQSDIDQVLLKYKSHNVSWIKLYADNSAVNSIISLDLLKSITRKAQALKFKVAIHAEYNQSVQMALLARPDSIEHFYEIPAHDVSNNINTPFVVITDNSLNTCENSFIVNNCFEKIKSLKNRLEWLRREGYKIVFGSDAVLDFTFNFKNRGDASLSSLISLTQIGLSPLETLLSATVTSADMLALPIGKIEKDYMANLVAFYSDPLINIENIKNRDLVVFKGKIVCKGSNECQP